MDQGCSLREHKPSVKFQGVYEVKINRVGGRLSDEYDSWCLVAGQIRHSGTTGWCDLSLKKLRVLSTGEPTPTEE